MATSTKAVSRALLNQETDARFWAQTHYKIGQPLNMNDPTDKAMAKVWQDIYLAVQKEDRAGRLHVTFNDPAVQASLADATIANLATQGHLDAAATAPDPAIADTHVQAATQTSAASSAAARDASARQPPTVSPIVVQAAAAESARALGQPPPPPVVYDLPADHPAVASPAARPELPVRAIVDPLPEGTPSPHQIAPAAIVPSPPRNVLAEARARAAPAVAVAVHEDAHKRARQGRRPALAGTTPPKALASLRGGAQDTARQAPGDFVGVTRSPSGAWAVSTFPTPGAAAAWYGDFTNDPSAYQYAAYYDKSDGATWPAPVEETLGSREEIPVRVQVQTQPARAVASPVPGPGLAPTGGAPGTSPVVPILIAGAAIAGLALIASASSSSSGSGSSYGTREPALPGGSYRGYRGYRGGP